MTFLSSRSRAGLLAAIPLSFALLVGSTAAQALSAGAGRADIALTPAMLPLDGFQSVFDPLRARVLLMDDGGNRVLLAVIDQTSIFEETVADLQKRIAGIAGASPENVLVIASHTFSAPHAIAADHLPPGMTMTPVEQQRTAAYVAAVRHAVDDATRQAVERLAAVHVSFGQATSAVAINRNHPSANGWWLGANAAEPSDARVGLLRLETADGRRMATLLNYAVQSSVMDHSVGASGGKAVTSDLGGAAVGHLESDGDGAIAFFLTGAAGDQMPAYVARRNLYDRTGRFRVDDLGDAAYPLVDLQGERLADAARGATVDPIRGQALQVRHGTVTLTGQERPKDLQQIKATRSYHYVTGGPVQAPFVLVQVGDVAIVGVQAELSAATGAYIRDHSPFPHTMVVTMVNGAAKYMPDADAYRKITYEAMNSSVVAGSAETMAAAVLRGLAAMRASPIDSR